jgi:hypothetical protein
VPLSLQGCLTSRERRNATNAFQTKCYVIEVDITIQLFVRAIDVQKSSHSVNSEMNTVNPFFPSNEFIATHVSGDGDHYTVHVIGLGFYALILFYTFPNLHAIPPLHFKSPLFAVMGIPRPNSMPC